MNYSSNLPKKELNFQLLVGIKKHLMIAQDTSRSKADRLTSLGNLKEVIEFVLVDLNEACQADEVAIYRRFFNLLITKLGVASVKIHQEPVGFADEIAFISVLLKM